MKPKKIKEGGALQSFKDFIDISKRPGLSLIYFLIFLIAFTFVIFAGVGGHIWYSYHQQRVILERNIRILNLTSKIALIDEIMTSSARLAAASQNLSWEKRFRRYESRQDITIRTIAALVRDPALNQDAVDLEKIDSEMVQIENQSFQLAKQGLFQDALDLLMGEQYRVHKDAFNRSLEHISGVMERDAEKNLRLLKHWVIYTGSALAYVGLMLIAVWFLIIHRLRRYLRDRDVLETAVREERDKAQMYLETAGVILIVLDIDGKITLINQRGCEILGYSKEELIGKNWFDMFVPEGVADNMKRVFRRILKNEEGLFGYYENPIITKTRDVRIIGWNNRLIQDDSGHVVGVISSGEDITKRKSSEESSRRLSTMYQTLFGVNRAILRIHDVQGLFDEVCRIAVEIGSFRMAWVGLLDPVTQQVKPAAQFGAGTELLNKFTVSIGDDPESQGITGRAIREGRYCVANDIASDIRVLTFRDDLLGAGHRSSAAFPIWRGGRIMGTFTFFAGQPDYFTHEQIELLQELSADISFALDFMDQQQQRAKAEESLKESEEWLRLAQHSAGAGVWDWDITSGNLRWSEELFELFGLGAGKVKPSFDIWRQIIHPDDRQNASDRIEQAVREGSALANEYRIILPSGEIRWINALGRTLYDQNKKPLRMSGICIDITQRKQAEEALRENEERLSLALSSAGMGTWYWDIRTNKRVFADQVCYLLGLDPKTFQGTAEEFFNVVHPDDREKVKKALAHTVEKNAPYEVEYRVVWPDGSVHHIMARGRLAQGVHGQPSRINGLVWDITARKKIEAQLQAALRDWQSTFDAIHDAVMILGKDFKILKANRAMGALIKRSTSEIIGETCYPLVHGSQEPHAQCPLHKMFQTKKYEEAEIYLSELQIWAWVTASPIFGPAGEIEMAVHTIRDITERKLLERTLMRGEERYEILAYQTGHLVYDYNIKTGAIDWAGAAEEVIGFSQAEADQTMDIKRWEEMIHPEDRAKTMEMLSEAEKTAGRFQTKYRFLHKNGNYVWIEDAGVFLKDKDGTCCRMVGMMKKIEG